MVEEQKEHGCVGVSLCEGQSVGYRDAGRMSGCGSGCGVRADVNSKQRKRVPTHSLALIEASVSGKPIGCDRRATRAGWRGKAEKGMRVLARVCECANLGAGHEVEIVVFDRGCCI